MESLRALRTAALRWYGRHGRQLPWRNCEDAYRVWLSEIMLQQTTVAAVVPYFERFTAAFPDVQTLAAAPLDDVLRLWEGLGYYSRARNLHRAAQVIVSQHGGVFPSGLDDLQSLPGIGRYTAGAIRSFAFNLPAPIVEANTERLFARLLGLTRDVRAGDSRRRLWMLAEALHTGAQESRRPRSGDLNQALMDLGAEICRPGEPRCELCPLTGHCRAFETGQQRQIPVRSSRPPVTAVTEACVVLQRSARVLIRRRSGTERWAGMWDFPRLELSSRQISTLRRNGLLAAATSRGLSSRPVGKAALPEDINQWLQDSTGLRAQEVQAAMTLTYSVTRYRVTLLTLVCTVRSPGRSKQTEQRWVDAAELEEVPLSRTGRQIAEWLSSRSLAATVRQRRRHRE
jgi:A/G-specific adenine glycosylase